MFSERILGVDTSALRRVLALVRGGSVISFAGGVPSPELFPMEELGDVIMDVSKMREAFQYGPALGIPELREELAGYMKSWSVETSGGEIMITHGSQQGIDVVARALIDPGDVIIVEAPTYFVALNTFQIYGPEFVEVPLDSRGISTELLEGLLQELESQKKKVKMIYTVPNFHNPAGVTMSERRRKKLAKLAEEFDFIILEDNPYGELRYLGKRVRSIRSFAPDRTIYLGSFSKIFAPGFRIAWLNAPKWAIERLEVSKQTSDVCTNTFGQYVTLEFMRRGYLWKNVERLRRAYWPKLRAMLKALQEFMPEGVEWTEPEGGMFVWLKTGKDADALLPRAVERGVAYVPGSVFYALKPERDRMRLNFTFESEDRINDGIRILAELLS